MKSLKIDTLFKEDTTVWYPLRNSEKGFYPAAYSLIGTIGSFSEPEALVAFIKGCYMTKNECQMHCDMWNAYNKNQDINEVNDIIDSYEKK